VKVAVVRSVGFVGVGAVIDATGAVRSIVQVNEAGAEALPAMSVAVTVKVWLPAASGPA
jgi:hypothetical protein